QQQQPASAGVSRAVGAAGISQQLAELVGQTPFRDASFGVPEPPLGLAQRGAELFRQRRQQQQTPGTVGFDRPPQPPRPGTVGFDRPPPIDSTLLPPLDEDPELRRPAMGGGGVPPTDEQLAEIDRDALPPQTAGQIDDALLFAAQGVLDQTD